MNYAKRFGEICLEGLQEGEARAATEAERSWAANIVTQWIPTGDTDQGFNVENAAPTDGAPSECSQGRFRYVQPDE